MEFGININLRNLSWYGLPEIKTIDALLNLPFTHVRIPIPLDEVLPTRNTWDFAKRDLLIEKALKKNKTIHLQLGLKTIGYPEAHIPPWLLGQCPSLNKKHCVLDQETQVQEIILEYLDRCAKKYFSIQEIATLHIENEAFSKRLSVTNYRSISQQFYEKELAFIKQKDTYHRPIIQNMPFDTPEKIPYVLKNSDIIGLNIYNQYNPTPLSQAVITTLGNVAITGVSVLNKVLQKRIYITEYQTAHWLTADKTPASPFSQQLFLNGLQQLKKLNPEIIFLWDMEQLLWKKDFSLLTKLGLR